MIFTCLNKNWHFVNIYTQNHPSNMQTMFRVKHDSLGSMWCRAVLQFLYTRMVMMPQKCLSNLWARQVLVFRAYGQRAHLISIPAYIYVYHCKTWFTICSDLSCFCVTSTKILHLALLDTYPIPPFTKHATLAVTKESTKSLKHC